VYKSKNRNYVYFLVFFISLLIILFNSLNSYSQNNKVVLLKIDGMINPASSDYIRVGLEKAKENSANALIIEMDTPGGLLNSTKDIVKMLLNSDIPVIVYISPSGASATSAGVFITLAANIAPATPGKIKPGL